MAYHVFVADSGGETVALVTCTDKRDARIEADRWSERGYSVSRDFDF